MENLKNTKTQISLFKQRRCISMSKNKRIIENGGGIVKNSAELMKSTKQIIV